MDRDNASKQPRGRQDSIVFRRIDFGISTELNLNSTPYLICSFGQAAEPLLALVMSSGKWENNNAHVTGFS